MSGSVRRPLHCAALLAALAVGCAGGAGADSEGEAAPQAEQAPAALTTVNLRVDGMHCESCSEAITAEVGRLDGVANCKVDHASGSASVQYDPALVNPPDMIAAIDRLGYAAAIAPKPTEN